ncbi:SDR family oxidoreductase [Candidatus Kryptobacter tengchongensis]|uniref:3-oxoacyl-[acyl-carrier protein] reductase n=1 Tax=Kryptobacter tengchongensis TaxID=1643429 RepID=A0A656D6I5_KRYT1|nr:SDR family oxidoreductase [Candidatus Kryptobacter tengchongensis]CUT01106.1 3-oxoacyl-[acyl-carrier protein] reductase [Candidatus Kryptobacter tengchongensis]
MDLGLKDKVAIVTASSKGLGKACAVGLVREGAKVVICARNEDELEKTKDEIKRNLNGEILSIRADVTKYEDVKNLVKSTVDNFGTVHILVTNAGGPPAGYFENFSDDDWNKAFNLNFMSTVRLIREVLPYMKSQKWGRIINITSVTVRQPIDNLILSNSIRMSVVGLAKTLALQLARYNILINNVAPGYTLTDRVRFVIEQQAKNTGKTFEQVKEELAKDIPLGRLADPEELANVVVFLASEKASYITGVTIPVDGGWIKGVF